MQGDPKLAKAVPILGLDPWLPEPLSRLSQRNTLLGVLRISPLPVATVCPQTLRDIGQNPFWEFLQRRLCIHECKNLNDQHSKLIVLSRVGVLGNLFQLRMATLVRRSEN
jgi:hypothetical protein